MSGDHLANGQKTGQGKKAISLFREWFNHKTRAAWSRQEEETRRVSLESLGQHDLANFLLWGFWSQEYENKIAIVESHLCGSSSRNQTYTQSVAESEEKEPGSALGGSRGHRSSIGLAIATAVLMSALPDQGVPSKLLQLNFHSICGKVFGNKISISKQLLNISSSKGPRLGFSTPTPYVDSMPPSKIKSCPVGPTNLYGS